MKNKKWLLVLIIAFPSLFWLILETSTIHSRRLPFYGPKSLTTTGDTTFHRVSAPFFSHHPKELFRDTGALLFAISFLAPEFRKDEYRIAGMWEYLKFKKEKIAPLPVVFVADETASTELAELENYPNVTLYRTDAVQLKKLRRNYFKEKPYYIDSSFFALVDAQRHIRGYYDARYASEIKRLLEEFQHLKLKEVKKVMIETNEIRTEN